MLLKMENEASLLVSDLHCYTIVDSIFNTYNIDVLRERMIKLTIKQSLGVIENQ